MKTLNKVETAIWSRRFLKKALEYRKVFRYSFLFALMLCFFTVPLRAQNPVASRGEQLFSFNQEECMSRARSALKAEGYTFLTSGTYSSIFGGKAIHTAGILCNPAPEAKMWVNIVVASISNDMNIPGAERVKLQERMEQSGTTRGCGWQDGLDPKAPSDDQGRGIANWQTHFQYASGAGRANVHALVGNRMAALRTCLAREVYARIYAAVSVRIGAVGRAQAGWIDGMDSRSTSDPGRALSDAGAHAAYVTGGAGFDTAHGLVAARLAELRDRIPTESYARLYADLSVLLAGYGVTGQGPA